MVRSRQGAGKREEANRNDMNSIILNVYIALILGCALYLMCIRFL